MLAAEQPPLLAISRHLIGAGERAAPPHIGSKPEQEVGDQGNGNLDAHGVFASAEEMAEFQGGLMGDPHSGL